jgi:glyoxylase-like metal-dependent hydrolase (beta-lactamase superfamily II)
MTAATSSTPSHPALHGITVLERGWLSSNNVVLPAGDGEAGATIVDTGHSVHAAQTLALLRHVLGPAPLARIVNTHLHSDHCGGNAILQAAFGAQILVPPGQADELRRWDETRLSHGLTGQRLDRFGADGLVRPGEVLEAGGLRLEVLPAPGHDPDSVMLYEPRRGLLLSADALWEHGFGVVFPEIAGEPGFDDVARVLDAIAALPVALVVPGHGAPFTDVAAALGRARERLQGFRREPARHARHAAKVLLKYHVMEEGSQAREALVQWALATALMQGLWQRFGAAPAAGSAEAWVQGLLDDLLRSGALRQQQDQVVDA